MKIIVLVENSLSDSRLREEFGLSLLIRYHGGSILFDMGATGRFAENARVMGEDLGSVDCGVVSHAHYDHGGGLGTFLELNSGAPVYVGDRFAGKYYGNIGAKLPRWAEPVIFPLVGKSLSLSRYIGIDRKILEDYPDRIVPVLTMREIMPDVYLLANIPGTHPVAAGNKYLLEKEDGFLSQDRFVHELIMVIREPDGLVLFTGCGHRSIVNMLTAVQNQFRGEAIKAVVGGFHLAMQPGKPGIAGKREDIEEIADRFLLAGVKRVMTGHCTGAEACAILEHILQDRFTRLSTGLGFTV